MNELLNKIAYCIERGKTKKDAPYPPDLKSMDGAFELTLQAVEEDIPPARIFQDAFMPGMNRIGEKFSKGEAFIPELLMSAEAMKTAMEVLRPLFQPGEDISKGVIILGTVAGDIHAIGKNIVKMVLEGDGWKVIDLGVDVTTGKFTSKIKETGANLVGMSALLTTSMINMGKSVKEIKSAYPDLRIFIGGAPVTQKYSDEIGADGYFPDPHSLAKYLNMKS